MMCLEQWKIISLNGSVVFEFLSFNKHQLLGLKANSRGFAGMSEKMCAKMT